MAARAKNAQSISRDEAPAPAPPSANTPFAVCQIDHVELFVHDRHEAARWYERTLGLTVVPAYEHWANDPHGPLMLATPEGDTKLAFFTGEPRHHRPTAGFHLVAFRVDADGFFRFLDHVAEAPVFTEDGREQHSLHPRDHGQAYSVYFCDPWGHRLEVTTYDHEAVRARLRAAREG
jgi:catechol 2,3-dioxygenase-like lactoylglutathione lyase family enzyme